MNYNYLFNKLNDFEKKNAPETLFHEGNFGYLLEGRRVSVVGSRKVSEEGLRRTKMISSLLVKHNITVVSGLASGVDTKAHITAIQEKGKTIAVLGNSLDNIYPKENSDLQNFIKNHHLVISQFGKGYPTTPKNFPIRNRTMALISDATIIIEAAEKSGTKHQGWEALRLGRGLFILESLVKEKNLSWVKEMIEYGAQILTKDNVNEMFESIPYLTSKLDKIEI